MFSLIHAEKYIQKAVQNQFFDVNFFDRIFKEWLYFDIKSVKYFNLFIKFFSIESDWLILSKLFKNLDKRHNCLFLHKFYLQIKNHFLYQKIRKNV